MIRTSVLLAAISALPLAACATAEAPPPASAARAATPAPAAEAESARLHRLFRESDEANLRRNPIEALFRGDARYADRLGDYLSDEYYAAEKAAAAHDLAVLATIDRSALSETDKIAYDVFKFQTEEELGGYADEILALNVVRPLNHFSGFQVFYPTFASGKGAAPFKTVEDYENNLKRHRDYVRLMDRSIERFRQGMGSGVLETQLTIRNVIEQLDNQLKVAPAESPYYGPATQYPESFSEADKARLSAAYLAAVRDELNPSYQRLRDFLADEYLPAAREGAGLVHMKGGTTLYRRLIEETTTLKLEPDYVHDLGLSEVARITREMEAIRRQVGFEGTLGEFFEHIRTAPQFKPESRDWLRERYYEIGREVDQRIATQFSTLPKSPLEIRAVEPFRERTAAGGSYQTGTPDGSRPGIFYYNAYNLDERLTPGMETLYLHEGAPGHHFQLSLAQENEALPNFMRFGGNTAFVEGWALYSETLGPELGLFTDPYQRFGHLNDEMLRAMRLVVDTGIHAKGWTREQAIRYMLEHSGMTNVEATSEVERYIAIPSQALAYKIGALTIQRLRAKAERELGDRFDVREFHEQVLGTGALPLAVLERKIDDWIAAKS